MSDLERVDRELEALGPVPAKLSELLARYGLRDRSLEHVDEALSGLGNGQDERLPTETLVDRPSFLPLGWDQKEDVPPAEAVAPAVELRDEITVTSPAPEPAPEPTFEPQATFAVPTPEPSMFAAGSSSPDAFATPEPTPAEPTPAEPTPVEPTQAEPARSHRPSRPDLQALLEQELDPREFPSSRPPAAMFSSRPPMVTPLPFLSPVPRSSLPPLADNQQPEPADEDFELLVDDDDILEIDE